jgi:hypothetical protein
MLEMSQFQEKSKGYVPLGFIFETPNYFIELEDSTLEA